VLDHQAPGARPVEVQTATELERRRKVDGPPGQRGGEADRVAAPGDRDLLGERTGPAPLTVHDGQRAQQGSTLQLGGFRKEDDTPATGDAAGPGRTNPRRSDREGYHGFTPR